MNDSIFSKSDLGALSAWKGFSSQTLYIANRILLDDGAYEYYPEDIEDLVIKKDGFIVEAVQVKNISSDLALSSLASSKTSKGGEGFFNRMCSLHTQDDSFSNIVVVYFGSLGSELQALQDGDKNTKAKLVKKLEDKHNLSTDDAIWLLDSLKFEKVSLDNLNNSIEKQISSYVPVMPAPLLAKDLLIQYISTLSNTKGYTSLDLWKEKIHEIGVSISAIDGFYKEYNKSLVLLSEFKLDDTPEELKKQFFQGVSAHPSHIRYGFDFKRSYWLEKIHNTIEKNGVVIIKGVSGQGKTALCYRYLIDNYPEGCVFCVRAIYNESHVKNLISALDGLSKNNSGIIIYIDVQPGEVLWAFLIQELQSRELNIPVLISIRDEDFNTTPFNGKAIQYNLIELNLSKEEAENIYNLFTSKNPHPFYRSFDEAWIAFGSNGPMIEFVYLLTNNETLTHRLETQIQFLISEKVPDNWLELLQLVCYAGRLGVNVDYSAVKKITNCSTMIAAIQRLKDEYLIRVTEDNRIEALHPVRAKIVYDILCLQIGTNDKDLVFNAISCVKSKSIGAILFDYFSNQKYLLEDIYQLSQIEFTDWIGFAAIVKTLLWLDTKRYVELNQDYIQSLVEKYGDGWLCLLPTEFSGVYSPNEFIMDDLIDLPVIKDKERAKTGIEEVKKSLSSLTLDYQSIDYYFKNCIKPALLPQTDQEKSSFGYSLFWLAKRGFSAGIVLNALEMKKCLCVGELQSSADAIRGLSEHPDLSDIYKEAVDCLSDRLITEMEVIVYDDIEDEVICKFIPPIENETKNTDETDYSNQYWRITMFDILKQLYPQKEYITIELVGVDLLGDFGINPLDYKLHIKKEKRYITWVTEINSWIRSRIEYSLRPSSWEQYVKYIDEIRTVAHELVEETIRFIDDVYKKERYTKERWKRVETRLIQFKKSIFKKIYLPIPAVDSYCLYSEGNANLPELDYFTMHQLLSVEKYKDFRQHLSNYSTGLENYFNQFGEVILARINKQDLISIDNSRLAMFNLYSSSKELYDVQREYYSLFSEYSSFNDNFFNEETESLLTLVNIWRHVLDYMPKKQAIAYNAKQQYRKGKNLSKDLLAEIPNEIKVTIIEGEEHIYIASNLNMDEGNTLESEYTNLVLKIRKIFQSAILESSNRWYCETQGREFVYVPLISDACLPSGFLIPFYILFDKEESNISHTMLPCEIEECVRDILNGGSEETTWITAMSKIQELKLYLKRFEQIINVGCNEKCNHVIKRIIERTEEKIKIIWGEFILCKSIVNQLTKDAGTQDLEMLNIINTFFGSYDIIINYIHNRRNYAEIIQMIDCVSASMIFLQHLVIKKE